MEILINIFKLNLISILYLASKFPWFLYKIIVICHYATGHNGVVSTNCCATVDSNQWRKGSESGALSLSNAARHIDFHSSRRIYVVLVAHSIALSLQWNLTFIKIKVQIKNVITENKIPNKILHDLQYPYIVYRNTVRNK